MLNSAAEFEAMMADRSHRIVSGLPGREAATGAEASEWARDDLTGGLGDRFECQAHGDFTQVRTPFLYPDGGIVDLFVRLAGDRFTVTDLGEALDWLKLQSISSQRSPKQQRLLQDVCLTLGVELFQGQLLARGEGSSRLTDAILRMGQAVVRVTDLWFTTRTRSVESVSDEVADLLQERQIPYERAVKLSGRSGRDWTVDFHTRTAHRSALVFVLASGSRAGARRVAEHVVAGWHDLSPMRVGPQSLRLTPSSTTRPTFGPRRTSGWSSRSRT